MQTYKSGAPQSPNRLVTLQSGKKTWVSTHMEPKSQHIMQYHARIEDARAIQVQTQEKWCFPHVSVTLTLASLQIMQHHKYCCVFCHDKACSLECCKNTDTKAKNKH